MTDDTLTLFHAPMSRSTGVLVLLEALQAPHRLHVLNLKAGTQRDPAFLAVNPMGKVPAILHGDALVTEQAAVYLYLADQFPAAGLAPPIGDPLRGPYLRWMVFYGSCFEPAIVDRAMKRDAPPPQMSPYGDSEAVLATLDRQLAAGPYLLGEHFSAADVLWGMALGWTTAWKLVPETPAITAYLARINARPAMARAKARDAELAAAQSGTA